MQEFHFDRRYTTQLITSDQFQDLGWDDFSSKVLLYDTCLESIASFSKWSESFSYKIPLVGGESLKSFSQLEEVLSLLMKYSDQIPLKGLEFVAVGGGSVGDFCGFLASIYKRGVSLVHIPSTWLSAIDSSHGGKTALNFGNAKNQIGSFYPAAQVYLIRELLFTQPRELALQSLSEMYKMALIDSFCCAEEDFYFQGDQWENLIWSNLESCVAAKYRVVQKDPFEQSGVRQILNLGHTFGHILESHFSISHGEAVARGLIFALKWSELKYEEESLKQYRECLEKIFAPLLQKDLGKLSQQVFMDLAAKDKKKNAKQTLNFIFVKSRGNCLIESLSMESFLAEAIRQGVVNG